MDPDPHVVVVGVGYVGLTAAACLSSLGRRVTAVDVDEARIVRLNSGEIPIFELGLDRLVLDGLHSGRLRFAATYDACSEADIVLLCLPTPTTATGELDLSYVEAALDSLRPTLRSGAIVACKSTVPVGSQRRFTGYLDRPDISVAANPEFLREGRAVADFLEPDRVVIGVDDENVGRRLAGVYHGVDAPIQITDPTSAELIKYAANTYLAAKLSFVNEISRLCDDVGADVSEVVAGLASDHRIGPSFLTPGPGWGGSCFPKDTRGLAAAARAAGHDLPLVEATAASNEIHFDHLVSRILQLCPDIGQRVAVWGATFKAGTDDVRDSPALAIIDRLRRRGVDTVVFDPVAATAGIPPPVADDLYSTCIDADILVVLTEWPEFAEADMHKVAQLLRSPTVYDSRGIISSRAAARAGLTLHRSGRPLRRLDDATESRWS